MHQKLISRAIFWLALGPSTMLFSAAAAAVAEHQNALTTIADPEGYIRPPRLDAVNTANQSDGSHNASGLASKFDPSAGAPTTSQDRSEPLRIPCLRNLFSGEPIEGNAEGRECSGRLDEEPSFSIQFDRHIGTRGSILGDVDGVRVDYRLTDGLTLNGVAGYPVLSVADNFNTNRQVFGLSADLARLGRSWHLNSYLIEQRDSRGPTGRAVGGAIRYVQTRRSLLFYTDYDFAKASQTAFTASGTWMPAQSTRIIATLDIRNSPIQKRQQNYLQHSMAAAKGWKWMLPSDRINQLANDRAVGISTLSVGLSRAFSQRLTLSGDVALINAANDEESDGKPLHKSFEYFSDLKLSANNLLVPGDGNVFSIRHRVTNSSQVSSARINTRYALNPHWTVKPRFSTDYRSKGHNTSVSRVSSSAVKLEYRWKKKRALQFELGGKWSSEESPQIHKAHSTYFLALGYQTKF